MLTVPLKAWNECKTLTAQYYTKMATAKKDGKKLAWVGAGIPSDLLRAFDVVPIFGEPFGAMCTWSNLSDQLQEEVENRGYGRSFCAYCRSFLGAYFKNKSPFGTLPEADFLAGSKGACNDHLALYVEFHHLTGKPLFILDEPIAPGEVKEYHLEYVERNFEKFIDFMEWVTGKKINEEEFCKTIILARKNRVLWDKVLSFCKNKPAPLNFKSQLTLMMPAIVLKGTQAAIDFYEHLIEELEERTSKGISAKEDEKYRLMWDNIPMWFHMPLFNDLENRGVVIVISPYTAMWGADMPKSYRADEKSEKLLQWKDPTNLKEAIREMAKNYLESYLGIELPTHFNYYHKLIKEYSIDGVIFHSNRGCKNISLGRMEVQRWIDEHTDVPTIIIEGNSGDRMDYSEGPVRTRLEAFLELLML